VIADLLNRWFPVDQIDRNAEPREQWLERLASRVVEFALLRIQIADSISHQFASLGWHVLARKRAP
jgi:hypothetical protein